MLEQIVLTILISYLLIVQLFNARLVGPLLHALGRMRVYEETIKSAWALSFVLLALVLLFNIPLEAVGFRFAPMAGDERAWQFFFLSCVLMSLAVVFVLLVKTSSTLKLRLRTYYQMEIEKKLLPHTREEERAWSAVSFTAGVTEEFIFRGVLIYTLSLYSDASPVTLAIVAGLLFGLAHAYQGLVGMVMTGIVGVGFGVLYVAMGVLWPIMVLHVLLDLIAGPVHVVSKSE